MQLVFWWDSWVTRPRLPTHQDLLPSELLKHTICCFSTYLDSLMLLIFVLACITSWLSQSCVFSKDPWKYRKASKKWFELEMGHNAFIWSWASRLYAESRQRQPVQAVVTRAWQNVYCSFRHQPRRQCRSGPRVESTSEQVRYNSMYVQCTAHADTSLPRLSFGLRIEPQTREPAGLCQEFVDIRGSPVVGHLKKYNMSALSRHPKKQNHIMLWLACGHRLLAVKVTRCGPPRSKHPEFSSIFTSPRDEAIIASNKPLPG